MKRPHLFLAFAVGLTGGIGGETLLFMQRQCAKIQSVLSDDFRIVLFLKNDLEESRQKIVADQLRGLPEVAYVRGISRQEAMADLRREDPELAESVTFLSDNPLNPAFEVVIKEAGFGNIAHFLAAAQPLADWSDIRYKPAQVRAIFQAQFYKHVIDLALNAILCLVAVMALTLLWPLARAGSRGWTTFSLAFGHKHPFPSMSLAATAAGALAGEAAVALVVAPMQRFPPWWDWPTIDRQILLVAGATVAGWILCGRGD